MVANTSLHTNMANSTYRLNGEFQNNSTVYRSVKLRVTLLQYFFYSLVKLELFVDKCEEFLQSCPLEVQM